VAVKPPLYITPTAVSILAAAAARADHVACNVSMVFCLSCQVAAVTYSSPSHSRLLHSKLINNFKILYNTLKPSKCPKLKLTIFDRKQLNNDDFQQ